MFGFKINYNELPARFRKGSVLLREEDDSDRLGRVSKGKKPHTKVTLLHCDIIGDLFWQERPYILAE
jgi:tRNA(His) guanylyltransferase